jgi:hypothetical protein
MSPGVGVKDALLLAIGVGEGVALFEGSTTVRWHPMLIKTADRKATTKYLLPIDQNNSRNSSTPISAWFRIDFRVPVFRAL